MAPELPYALALPVVAAVFFGIGIKTGRASAKTRIARRGEISLLEMGLGEVPEERWTRQLVKFSGDILDEIKSI